MEKLTSLAALRVGDLEKVQRLEAELEKAATHRHSYEEKGRRYRDSMEEVRSVPHERRGPPSRLCTEANVACASVKQGFRALTREPRGLDSEEKLREGLSFPPCPPLQADTSPKEHSWLLPLLPLSHVHLHGCWRPPFPDP